ncbi:MAG: sulfatase-like hydrolase/transferase [Fusicatenibacter sp.]|nr:sulfatase-like hydrolase/transferase [Fusicatenibacter sp.]
MNREFKNKMDHLKTELSRFFHKTESSISPGWKYLCRQKVFLSLAMRALVWLLLFALLLVCKSFLEETSIRFPIFLILLLFLAGSDFFFEIRHILKGTKRHTISRFSFPHFCLIWFNALISFWQIEYLCNDTYQSMIWTNIILGVSLTAVIYFCIVLACNSLSVGMIIGNIFFLVWGIASYFVLLFRGTPLQYADLFAAGTAMEVLDSYDFILTGPLVQFCLVALFWCLYYIQKWDCRFGRIRSARVLSHLLGIGACAGCYVLLVHSTILTDTDISLSHWNPTTTYKTYGTETAFLAFAEDLTVRKPEGYSQEKVQELADTAVQTAASEPSSAFSDVTPTNIILIMNETWTDFTIFPTVHLDQDYLPFYHSMTENTIKGNLYVSTWGSGTDRTEYEVLTGHSMALNPGTQPYCGYFTSEHYSLVSTLKAQGYETIAVHPSNASNWSRNRVYDYLGFDDFLSIDDFEDLIHDPTYGSSAYVRSYISDACDFRKLEQIYEEKEEDQPLFVFNVTIQNHGGYTDASYPATIHLTDFDGEGKDRAEQFLSLAYETDAALADLIAYFSQVDEPTMICMFGDHHPATTEAFQDYTNGANYYTLPIEEQQYSYATPYFIWTNYDSPEAENADLSSNYLGSVLLKAANLELTPYNEYLLSLKEQIPVLNAFGYIGFDGEMHSMEEEGREELNLIQEYYYMIYNELKGGSSRLDSVYTIGQQPDSSGEGILASGKQQ